MGNASGLPFCGEEGTHVCHLCVMVFRMSRATIKAVVYAGEQCRALKRCVLFLASPPAKARHQFLHVTMLFIVRHCLNRYDWPYISKWTLFSSLLSFPFSAAWHLAAYERESQIPFPAIPLSIKEPAPFQTTVCTHLCVLSSHLRTFSPQIPVVCYFARIP